MKKYTYKIEALGLKHALPLTEWFNSFVDQDLGVVENFHVTVESEKKYIRDYLNNLKVGEPTSFIAFLDGTIVGKVDIRPLSRYIDKHVIELGFGVLKEHSKAGEELLWFIEGLIRERGFEVVLYFILARNTYFRDLFKTCGFDEVGKIAKFYKNDDIYDDRIILEKVLI